MNPMIASAGIQAGGSLASSAFGHFMSRSSDKKSMKRQKRYTIELNRRQYQDQVYSLKQAGLNPMLATGMSSGGGSPSAVSSARNVENFAKSGVDVYMARKLLDKQIENIEAQTAKTVAETGRIEPESKIGRLIGSAITSAKQAVPSIRVEKSRNAKQSPRVAPPARRSGESENDYYNRLSNMGY